MPLYFVLTGYLKLREKRLIVLKETAREIRRQLLEILRLILFIPTGFLVATIVKFPLFFLARIQESMFGLRMDSWGTHLQNFLIKMVITYTKNLGLFQQNIKS